MKESSLTFEKYTRITSIDLFCVCMWQLNFLKKKLNEKLANKKSESLCEWLRYDNRCN